MISEEIQSLQYFYYGLITICIQNSKTIFSNIGVILYLQDAFCFELV